MYKSEKHCSQITQFVNGKAVKIRNDIEGSALRTNDGILRYTAKNSVAEDLFETSDFFESCADFIWERDFEHCFREMVFSNLISKTVTIRNERVMKRFCKDAIECIENCESTKIEIRINAVVGSQPLSIKRETYFPNNLSTFEATNAVLREVERINHDYAIITSNFFSDCNPDDMDVILPAGKGGIFVHEAIGHCLEGDLFFSKKNVLHGKLGHKLTTNSQISITDSCNVNDVVSYKVSDDGTPCSSVHLVKNGYLSGVMTDLQCAMNNGVEDSGNGRSMDCFTFPIPRMRNTFLHNGDAQVDEIIKTTKSGVIPIDIMGGNVNVENGCFVFNVLHGLIIKEGDIVGISGPFLFSGNVITALDSIDAIGNDLSFTYATCGKMGQHIDVSYGQPTIRIARR